MLAQGGYGGHTVDSLRPPVKTVRIIGMNNNQIGKISSQRLSAKQHGHCQKRSHLLFHNILHSTAFRQAA